MALVSIVECTLWVLEGCYSIERIPVVHPVCVYGPLSVHVVLGVVSWFFECCYGILSIAMAFKMLLWSFVF